MEQKKLLEILNRDCNKNCDILLVNVGIMGAAPTICAFVGVESLTCFIQNHPELSFNLVNIPLYD